MTLFYVIAEYRDQPSEGMQVVSKTLVDGLREEGHRVHVFPIRALWRWLPHMALTPPGVVVFTHGPGKGVVLASTLLRRIPNLRIVWLATRPDLSRLPAILRGRKTAHVIVGNRVRSELRSAAKDHTFMQQFIGINPSRLDPLPIGTGNTPSWSASLEENKKVILHVGHLRPNRGLDLLVEAKRALGDSVHIVIQGSPTFEPDQSLVRQLEDVGIIISRAYVTSLGDLYRACDIYVFPARPEAEGAIELPLSILEAVACQRPILTNEFGAVRDALGGVAGVHITSPDLFVAALTKLVEDPAVLGVSPPALPDALDARRLTSAILKAAGEI